MSSRVIAIGDIHGCIDALRAIIAAVDLRQDDTLVTLGDCVDRGPDSRATIDYLLQLRDKCHLVPLLGNHEELLLAYVDGRPHLDSWLDVGGRETIASYGGNGDASAIDPAHVEFIRTWEDIWQNDTHFCVHGNYMEDVPFAEQRWNVLRWMSLYQRLPDPHISGKKAIVGHTHQKSGEVFDLGYLTCIDTHCYGKGWLTALELETSTVWQANIQGELRQ